MCEPVTIQGQGEVIIGNVIHFFNILTNMLLFKRTLVQWNLYITNGTLVNNNNKMHSDLIRRLLNLF